MDNLPNFLEDVAEIYKQIGPYKSTKYLAEKEVTTFYGPYQKGNYVYYGGMKNGKREGACMQIWSEGSFYEGIFKEDIREIDGRLIHSDGDYYFGEWKEDKTSGHGIYCHKDGARYE